MIEELRKTEDLLIEHYNKILGNKNNTGKSKYKHISTIDVVNRFRNKGWIIRTVDGSNTFANHVVRMVHPEMSIDEDRLELVITNSYDGRSKLKVSLGIFRLVCSNGLVVGDIFYSISQKHIGPTVEQDLENKYERLIAEALKLMKGIQLLKSTKVDNIDPKVFKRVLEKISVDAIGEKSTIYDLDFKRLLHPKRPEDEGTGLWETMNVVQEKVINGGVPFLTVHSEKGKVLNLTKKRSNVLNNIKLNKTIFDEFLRLVA